MTARVVNASFLEWLRIEVARLGLPVTLELDGTTVVIVMPRDLNTAAEIRVLRVVELHTADFRRQVC